MACIGKGGKDQSNNNDQYGFKIVPESLNDITADWCEKALQKGSTISKETKVTNLEVQCLTSDEIGADGGGLSGSTLVKLIPTYSGNVTGNEPKSMVCKISGNTKRDIAFVWRAIFYAQIKAQWDEYMSRVESNFYKEIVPLLQDTGYSNPKMYFNGLDDNGNSSFTEYVILNGPIHTKLAMVMEDLSGWTSAPPGYPISKDQMILCLKNVSILHARFWGEKGKSICDILKIGPSKTDQDMRPAHYSKVAKMMRKGIVSSTENIKKRLSSLSKWENHFCMKLPSGYPTLPQWLTIDPLDDGSYEVLKDPLVKEMLEVAAQRLPKYNEEKLKNFIKREPQTLIHGDFHGGNHMYGTGENEDKVVALDYQMLGKGLVACEFWYMQILSWGIRKYEDFEESGREYHNALVENGVKDYSLAEFFDDLEMAIVEYLVNMMNTIHMGKPETFMNLFRKMCGEEKAEGFMKVFKQGMFCKSFLILTSMYVKDKDNFLMCGKN